MNVKPVALALLCAATLYGAQVPASAISQDALNEVNSHVVDIPVSELDSVEFLPNAARTTTRFDWSVSSGSIKKGSTAFSLDQNAIITISGAYTPDNASVDVGLYTSDGSFYYLNVTKGSFDASIKVPKTGKYYFAVRNNSKSTIKIVGTVYC